MKGKTHIFAAILGLSVIPANGRPQNAPVVTIQNGSYYGQRLSTYNQDAFLGIPFAQPPLGHLRWRNPQSVNTTWTGTRPATGYAMECIGYGTDQIGYLQNEDCLYLNVIRPSGFENASLPVLFWIHGGGFAQGGTPDLRYNLSFIVENSVAIGKPIMAVGTAYRLGPFGFFNSESVAAEGGLNLGLKDQRLAMQWVHENIAAFGGDPTKVTIYGQSAGAESVGYHLRAFGGRNDSLFRGAIMESGPVIPGSALNDTAAYTTMVDGLVTEAGCANVTSAMACLRNLPFTVLNNVLNQTAYNKGWNPTVDGDFVQDYPSKQLKSGEFLHVPIIVGATTDDGTTETSPTPINTTEELKFYMITTTSSQPGLPEDLVDQLLDVYPNVTTFGIPSSEELGGNVTFPQPYGAAFRQAAAYWGDKHFISGRRATAQAWAAAGLDAYSFRFNTKPSGETWEEGCAHFTDVAFIFNNLNGLGYAFNPFVNKSEAYVDLSYLMSNSWVSFVSDLNPNSWDGKGRNVTQTYDWPTYTVDNPMNMVWDANLSSYAEPDTWRAEGIKLIVDNAELYLR